MLAQEGPLSRSIYQAIAATVGRLHRRNRRNNPPLGQRPAHPVPPQPATHRREKRDFRPAEAPGGSAGIIGASAQGDGLSQQVHVLPRLGQARYAQNHIRAGGTQKQQSRHIGPPPMEKAPRPRRLYNRVAGATAMIHTSLAQSRCLDRPLLAQEADGHRAGGRNGRRSPGPRTRYGCARRAPLP